MNERKMIERKGNYIDGNRMQMDYDELLLMAQIAHMDKKNELIELLSATWNTDTYQNSSYHQHTRGMRIACLAKEFERIASVLHHLQALGKSKKRQTNFSWYFNEGDEEE
jgi:HJR/Mrr/RecB family endonuclease